MAKITIETESAAELKKVFTDLFGTPAAKAESAEKPVAPKAAVKPAEVKPAEVKPAEVKPAEVKPAESAAKEPTYSEVMDRIKKMKVTTNPNIVSAVKVWKEEGNHPDLKSMTGAELLTVVVFLDTLTPEA
jgi:hypothetical protein